MTTLRCAPILALALLGCSGANDSGASNGGDSGGETEIPVGTCHLTLFHQASTNMKAVTIDLGNADFADLRCDVGSGVCAVDTHPATSAADGINLTFKPPKAGDSQQFALTGAPQLEIVQVDGATTDSWTSVSGRIYFTDVSATTGITFSLVEIGMDAESISNNGATGTFQVNMDCRGLPISGI